MQLVIYHYRNSYLVLDGSQLSIDLSSPKYFIDPELIHEVESRIREYTKIVLSMQIRAAGDNILNRFGTLEVMRDAADLDR